MSSKSLVVVVLFDIWWEGVPQGGLRLPFSHFRFAVNFLCANGDIAFHFNPRFDMLKPVVCNTKQNGGWGKEERWPIPFEAGATFMMIIDVMSDCYRVRLPAGLRLRRLPVRHWCLTRVGVFLVRPTKKLCEM
uniref:Galectin n=1 Tax=Podarcis muralis TaxID=64176 RepID=A0A670IQV8_PODMU